MRDRRDPRSLDIAALCREGGALSGRLRLEQLQRLAGGLFGPQDQAAEAAWSVQAQLKPVAGGEPERWLRVQVQAEVGLQCQRCLDAVRQPLTVDRNVRFVKDEQDAERLDEELDDDVLALPPRLDLIDLIEDELILALPIVPRHEGGCPRPLALPDDPGAGADEPAPNPFAKLAGLRRNLTPGDPGTS